MDGDQGTGLADRIARFPNLGEVLGSRWVAEQERIDPALSRYALARWLRIRGFSPDLATLDTVIRQLRHLPGFAERRDRLRSDAGAVMETLTELYFAAWLLEAGYEFELTRVGADFRIRLGEDSILEAEVTSPRRAVWSQDLFERLDLVKERYGYAVALEEGAELLPDPSASEAVVTAIVERSLALLEEQTARPPASASHPSCRTTRRPSCG